MISITSGQIDAWIVAYAFPMVRILGFIAIAPFWGSSGIPRRTRLILGIALAIALAPALPPMPSLSPGSLKGLWVMLQQMLIGLSMGFAARIVFSAFEFMGEVIGAQMGLGFATFYDPMSSSQTPVIAEFFTLLATLIFFAFNGHLLYFSALAQSFWDIPITMQAIDPGSWRNLLQLGSKIFSFGLFLALPILVALIITNLALGVLTRAAPQLNLFAIGFPLTLMLGFATLVVCLDYLAQPIQGVFEFSMKAIQESIALRP